MVDMTGVHIHTLLVCLMAYSHMHIFIWCCHHEAHFLELPVLLNSCTFTAQPKAEMFLNSHSCSFFPPFFLILSFPLGSPLLILLADLFFHCHNGPPLVIWLIRSDLTKEFLCLCPGSRVLKGSIDWYLAIRILRSMSVLCEIKLLSSRTLCHRILCERLQVQIYWAIFESLVTKGQETPPVL